MSEPPVRIWHQSLTVLEDLAPYEETLRRHAERVLRPGSSLVLHGMLPGTYPSDYPGEHIRYSYLLDLHGQQFVRAALQAEDEGFDAFFIATIPDVAFEHIRSLVDIPVVAYGQASLLSAAMLGNRVGIINFIEPLADRIRRNTAAYGLAGLLGPIVQLEAQFHDITAGYAEPEPLITAFHRAAERAVADGANVIVPGEAPLNVFLADHDVRRIGNVPIVDSVASGLKFCELSVDLRRAGGPEPSRAGFYYEQPPRDVVAAVHRFYANQPTETG